MPSKGRSSAYMALFFGPDPGHNIVYMRPGKLYIGTSGWQYAHWRGVFYPQGLSVKHQLEYYSQHFSATEINSTFYRLPSKAAVARWMDTVPKKFRFCPKISRFITHAKKLNDPQQAVPRFFDVFDPYRRSCGPVLLQLPAMLAFNAEKAGTFFDFLREQYPDWHFSLEARHDSWMSAASAALLEKHRIGWVMVDAGRRWPSSYEIVTTRHIYIRLHGPDGSYATKYTARALHRLAEKCLSWRDSGHDCWIFFNNDIHGYAVGNARQLQQLTGGIGRLAGI